jgi:hypothetical protein
MVTGDFKVTIYVSLVDRPVTGLPFFWLDGFPEFIFQAGHNYLARLTPTLVTFYPIQFGIRPGGHHLTILALDAEKLDTVGHSLEVQHLEVAEY